MAALITVADLLRTIGLIRSNLTSLMSDLYHNVKTHPVNIFLANNISSAELNKVSLEAGLYKPCTFFIYVLLPSFVAFAFVIDKVFVFSYTFALLYRMYDFFVC